MLFYCLGEDYLYVVLIDQKGDVQPFQLVEWRAAFPLIDELLDALEGNRTSDETRKVFETFSRGWGRRLLPSPACLEGFDVLIIIPHQSLHGVPIHAIQPEATNQFLATSHAVSYCSSATLFAHCVARNPARASNLGVEFWTYALDEGGFVNGAFAPRRCYAVGIDPLGMQTDQFRQLAGIVAGCFAEPEVDMKSTRRTVKVHLSQPGSDEVLCIIAHGYYAPLVSDHSGVVLGLDPFIGARDIHIDRTSLLVFRDMPMRDLPAGFETSVEAELLTLAELKLETYCDAELVTLLACSTAAGEVLSGGDVNSFAYQWLKIGAASVLANFWELDLEFATAYAPLFFRRWLSQRQPKAIAWQQTLKELLDRSPDVDPYTWAPVALFGDWL